MCQEHFDITYDDLNPRFLFSCIVDRTEDETNYHSHDFIELAVILKGEGNFFIENQTYPVQKGDILILNPGVHHKSMIKPLASSPATECYLAFSNVQFRECLPGTFPLFEDGSRILHMPQQLRPEIFRLCMAIGKESENFKIGRYFMLKSYLIQILCLLIREMTAEKVLKGEKKTDKYFFKSVSKKYVVQKITKYLEEHYREKISLDQIAANMYLSPYYISKIFKTETGDTPINYLISIRMGHARELLDEDPDISIQTVSAAVGYEDAYHFSKLFKKYYGLSPLHYKGRADL